MNIKRNKKIKEMGRSAYYESQYSYKAWCRNPLNSKKSLDSYSARYDELEDAKKWYDEKGKRLEKVRGIKLILVQGGKKIIKK